MQRAVARRSALSVTNLRATDLSCWSLRTGARRHRGDIGVGYARAVEGTSRNNPIPFLVLATAVGLLLGSWWIGLLVGIGMTIIPGVALIALFINNLVRSLVGYLFLLLGFPFYLAYKGVRRILGSRPSTDDGHEP